MDTPETAKQKLRQLTAIALASLVAVGLGAAALWPRDESLTLRHASKVVRDAPDDSQARRLVHPGVIPRTSGKNQPEEAPAQPTEQTALDEPAPRITVVVKEEEQRAFELDQQRKSAVLEEELKTRLTPEQLRSHEKGLKIWQERLRSPQ